MLSYHSIILMHRKNTIVCNRSININLDYIQLTYLYIYIELFSFMIFNFCISHKKHTHFQNNEDLIKGCFLVLKNIKKVIFMKRNLFKLYIFNVHIYTFSILLYKRHFGKRNNLCFSVLQFIQEKEKEIEDVLSYLHIF